MQWNEDELDVVKWLFTTLFAAVIWFVRITETLHFNRILTNTHNRDCMQLSDFISISFYTFHLFHLTTSFFTSQNLLIDSTLERNSPRRSRLPFFFSTCHVPILSVMITRWKRKKGANSFSYHVNEFPLERKSCLLNEEIQNSQLHHSTPRATLGTEKRANLTEWNRQQDINHPRRCEYFFRTETTV